LPPATILRSASRRRSATVSGRSLRRSDRSPCRSSDPLGPRECHGHFRSSTPRTPRANITGVNGFCR
jgi:hypothetical protein